MGIFSKDRAEPVATQPAPVTYSRTSTSTDGSNRRSGLFGKRNSRASTSTTSSASPARTTTTTTTTPTHTTTTKPGVLSRLGGNKEDASITAARQRVMQAEQAEREADAALVQARSSVREAREHVRALEREAAEEARLAKIKQNQAADISKRAAPLGRHG